MIENKVRTGGIGQGVLWLGAWAVALFGAKYAWQRARENFHNTNFDQKYIDTAEKVLSSVVGGD